MVLRSGAERLVFWRTLWKGMTKTRTSVLNRLNLRPSGGVRREYESRNKHCIGTEKETPAGHAGMVADTCNPSPRGGEAGGSLGVQG